MAKSKLKFKDEVVVEGGFHDGVRGRVIDIDDKNIYVVRVEDKKVGTVLLTIPGKVLKKVGE